MKRLLLTTAFALSLLPAPAQAMEGRISLFELRTFLEQYEAALNAPNLNITRYYLDRAATPDAVFEERVFSRPSAPYRRDVMYKDKKSGTTYRYPSAHQINVTDYRSLSKKSFINEVSARKQNTPGFAARVSMAKSEISPYAQSAVLEVAFREYGLMRDAYNQSLLTTSMLTYSKCRMYMQRQHDETLQITRLDCNTNTNLPAAD